MPTLALKFPGGRYHATPWGHHVNEGLIEWPPSPWRILRALISVGYTTLGWKAVPPEARSAFERLASVLPVYRVARATAAHSRHYMPIDRLRKDGIQNTTMVFDAWAHVASSEIRVHWDVLLDTKEVDILATLASNLGYLGRSESWVDACLTSGDRGPLDGDDVLPSEGRARPGPEWEQVAVLAPEAPSDYAAWRTQHAPEPPLENRAGKPKRGAKKGVSSHGGEAYPSDLIACLEVDTRFLQRHGWGQPPGSRTILYWQRRDALEAGAPAGLPDAVTAEPVEVMVLALATNTKNSHALPSVVRTLPQAELLHRAVVSHLESTESCAVLTGKSVEGKPLEGHHHAHVLPVDMNGDGHLDHIFLWAPMGMNATAQAAVRNVRRTHMKGGVGELRVAIMGLGDTARLRSLPGVRNGALWRILGPTTGARQWITETPFVPPRHLKSGGRNTLQGQVRAELESRGVGAPVDIEVIDARDPSIARFRHFVLNRRRGPLPPARIGFAMKLSFAEPVMGPLCLGYGSHFGLGRFAALSTEEEREP